MEFSGFVLDPAKCSGLSLGEKRELVHEVAKCSKNAAEVLSSFSRRELLEIICAEMGKERKYSGYTKFRMIEHLLKLVSQKSKRTNSGTKRKRHEEILGSSKVENVEIRVCENVACRATLSLYDAFCKRCSCCICYKYDDNKDPSLWLTCGSDPSSENVSCGLSCHLDCALKDKRVGIPKLDGGFYCVTCGKINDLMRSWRKQLLIAKETRRVDVLCLRISLAQKILSGSEKYRKLQTIVETALDTLKHEVGPLDLLCTKMARGIVNRLSCGAEVQKLCASAMEAFDSLFVADHVEKNETASCQIRFEGSSPTSTIILLEYDDHLIEDFVGCRLWHRKSTLKNYPEEPNFIVLRPEKRFYLTDLDPSTEYFCKVSLFKSTGAFGVWEAKWTTPMSNSSSSGASFEYSKDENTEIATIQSHVESINSNNSKLPLSPADISKNKDKGPPTKRHMLFFPPTPCKCDGTREGQLLGCEKRKEENEYEYSVRVVKWLEREGHIDECFRVKFLTWFSLKATMQERKVVSVFVDVMIDDPPILAGQLIHTFMDEICFEQKPVHGNGFCTRFWH